MKRVRGVIFDCDGVLFESRAANLAYYNVVLEHFDAPPVLPTERERAHLCHTAASPRVFEELLGSERRDQALAMAAQVDYRQFIPKMTPEPFMAETIAFLSERLPLAVATNRGVSMLEILQHFCLSDYFRTVVTSRDVPRPKPFPDMLHVAARRLGLREAELLFIGDSDLDLAAATAAGMPFLAYRNPGLGVDSIDSHRQILERLEG